MVSGVEWICEILIGEGVGVVLVVEALGVLDSDGCTLAGLIFI